MANNAYIKNLIDYNGDIIYPQTRIDAIFNTDGTLLSNTVAFKPQKIITSLVASKWDSTNKSYSFETDYPNALYDLEVEIDGDNCTDEQYEAWTAVIPMGSQSNKINARGDIPTINIPIILTITKK